MSEMFVSLILPPCLMAQGQQGSERQFMCEGERVREIYMERKIKER